MDKMSEIVPKLVDDFRERKKKQLTINSCIFRCIYHSTVSKCRKRLKSFVSFEEKKNHFSMRSLNLLSSLARRYTCMPFLKGAP